MFSHLVCNGSVNPWWSLSCSFGLRFWFQFSLFCALGRKKHCHVQCSLHFATFAKIKNFFFSFWAQDPPANCVQGIGLHGPVFNSYHQLRVALLKMQKHMNKSLFYKQMFIDYKNVSFCCCPESWVAFQAKMCQVFPPVQIWSTPSKWKQWTISRTVPVILMFGFGCFGFFTL